jgi:molecular chaperone DnaK (HSP70)
MPKSVKSNVVKINNDESLFNQEESNALRVLEKAMKERAQAKRNLEAATNHVYGLSNALEDANENHKLAEEALNKTTRALEQAQQLVRDEGLMV